jgi:hypothetical protein
MSKESSNLPAEKWLPEYDPVLDEESVLELFTQRVEEMMRDNLDLLLSSLYRLDVEEYKIQRALRSSTIPPARGIAMLILDRQKERLRTRNAYRNKEKKDWEGL